MPVRLLKLICLKHLNWSKPTSILKSNWRHKNSNQLLLSEPFTFFVRLTVEYRSVCCFSLKRGSCRWPSERTCGLSIVIFGSKCFEGLQSPPALSKGQLLISQCESHIQSLRSCFNHIWQVKDALRQSIDLVILWLHFALLSLKGRFGQSSLVMNLVRSFKILIIFHLGWQFQLFLFINALHSYHWDYSRNQVLSLDNYSSTLADKWLEIGTFTTDFAFLFLHMAHAPSIKCRISRAFSHIKQGAIYALNSIIVVSDVIFELNVPIK